ncbi:MAG: succinyl-diaminopimelate desuccinylase [Chthonomonas sp.]|nr:succinyl-diaminopimelate desuccinylase [Chthonomonas sp.]
MTVRDLACQLIACPSVTPDEAGCMAMIREFLTAHGFACRMLDRGGVTNLWATRGEGRTFCLYGHCDVVPPGPREAWATDPFVPTIEGDTLFGRGASDMKGPLAAVLIAATQAQTSGRVAVFVTSDEEGPGVHGTEFALPALLEQGERIDAALVAEPTSEQVFGDVLKVGRRGSFGGKIRFLGKQGHVAYPHLAENPIHAAAPALQRLLETTLDTGGDGFAPSAFQVTNIQAGTGATNVTPGECEVMFNIRYGVKSTPDSLRRTIETALQGTRYELDAKNNSSPFLTAPGPLTSLLAEEVERVAGRRPELGTGGGTSDARVFAACGIPVAEFGPSNATIHAANECVSLSDLEKCVEIYRAVTERFLADELA